MATNQSQDRRNTSDRAADVVRAIKAGATLTWYPIGGYYLETAERAEHVQWHVGAAARRAGLIVTDDHDLKQPRVWRLAAK